MIESGYEFAEVVMNHALELATEWGENFRQPINDRMRLMYPDLTDDEISRLKKLADEAESCILSLADDELADKLRESDIVPMAHEKYPWVYEQQLYRIKNYGMYWAR